MVSGAPITEAKRVTGVIAFTVPGRPVSWARSATVKGRTLTPKAQREAKARIRAHALATGIRRWYWPMEGAFSVEVTSYYRSAVVGDSDRSVGLVLDALEGVAYHLDRQVRTQTGSIIADGSPERVVVTVRRLDVDPVQTVATRAKRVS